jgi:branched-chain amino acid transport system permease protein
LPSIFGTELSDTGYYLLVVVAASLTLVLFRNLVHSRHGVALKVMRESPTLARSLGISLPRLKLTAYVIGALPAGAAGALFAYHDGFVSPDSFSFHLAVTILAASVIGGSASIYGAVVGAAIMVFGPLQVSSFQNFSTILFGLLLLVAGLFFTGGLAGMANKIISNRLVNHEKLLPDVEALLAGPVANMQVTGRKVVAENIEKTFGGNRALKGVTVSTEPGKITALIGPNGSGKTTLLNVISGFYSPTSGRIRIADKDVTAESATSIARRGVSRTFQTPVIPKGMRAVDVVASARYARVRSTSLANMVRWPSAVRVNRTDRAEALRLLHLMGIAHLADREASALPLGTQRLLEVARALAGNPAVVLLDEPASGLDESEVASLGEVLIRLTRAGANVLIVEHNFEMIMRIADEVNVLHLGEIIASGGPEAVRNNPDVVESYLGKKARADLEARIISEAGV